MVINLGGINFGVKHAIEEGTKNHIEEKKVRMSFVSPHSERVPEAIDESLKWI